MHPHTVQFHICRELTALYSNLDRSAYSKKVKTHTNTAYGVVPPRREDPVYDVILSNNTAAAKPPLYERAATASTTM